MMLFSRLIRSSSASCGGGEAVRKRGKKKEKEEEKEGKRRKKKRRKKKAEPGLNQQFQRRGRTFPIQACERDLQHGFQVEPSHNL